MTRRSGEPGSCPICESIVDVPVADYSYGGHWDGRSGGGLIYAVNCPSCGFYLHYLANGPPETTSSTTRIWYSNGRRDLASGDRWRGRPGAWQLERVPQFKTRLRQLLAKGIEHQDAILTLHTTTGIGALHLVPIVQDVLGLSERESRRLVVASLSPFEHDASE